MNIHCFPKNVAPGNVFSVELDLPFTRRIIVQHSAQQRAVSSHLLLFGKLLNRFVLFFLFFRSLNVICKEASAGRFKEVAFTPRPIRKSDIKCPFPSAFESRNNFLGRSDEPERTSKVIRRAEREHT